MQKTIKIALADSDPGARNSIDGVLDVLKNSNGNIEFFRFQFYQNAYLFNDTFLTKEELLSKFDSLDLSLLITGTSVDSSLEYELINKSLARGIHSVGIIDHWVNYKKRFVREGRVTYPSLIMVNDQVAREAAIKDGIPEHILEVYGNPWWYKLNRIRQNLKGHKQKSEKKNILFLSDNLSETWKDKTKEILGYTEFEVLSDLIRVAGKKYKITIRLHPKDREDKYSSYLSVHKVEISERSIDLWEQVTNMDVVIGMFSNSLLDSSFFNSNILRYEPGRKVNYLPTKMIKEYSTLQSLTKAVTDIQDHKGIINVQLIFKADEFIQKVDSLIN